VGDFTQYGVAGSEGNSALLGSTSAMPLTARNPDTVLQKHSILENTLVLGVLVLSTTAFVNLFPGEHGLEYGQEGLVFAQVLWSLLYFGLWFLVRNRILEFVRLMWQSKLLVLLLGWACLSVIWSIDQQATIRHFVALLFTSLFGTYFSMRYDLREQMRFVSIALGIVLVASVAACLAFPEYGISSENPLEKPAWQGVLSHKNNLATLVVLAVLVLFLYYIRGIRRSLIVVGIVLLFFLVVLTQSKTSLLYFVLSIIAFPFLRVFHIDPSKRRKIVAFALLLAIGLATWTYSNWENFTYSLGKDPGLTGRFELWVVALASIRERPLFGYGLDAFWSNYYGPAADFRLASCLLYTSPSPRDLSTSRMPSSA